MSAPDFSVSGQHVLISGGAGGIGTAFAEAFRGAGAHVTICDLKPPSVDAGFDFEHLDVRDNSAIEALAAAKKAHAGDATIIERLDGVARAFRLTEQP
jgi:NAD(P)-dependent dehydrogenase (short-subunit alcohol dehydrogenase family)